MESVQTPVQHYSLKAVQDVPADTRRGGKIFTLLSPKTCDTRAGFMGVAIIDCNETIAEHYHPYSDEFVYVSQGKLTACLNDELQVIHAGQALHIPKNVRHRFSNLGEVPVELSFFTAPLAPRPEMGHVDTETAKA